ncbi:MAG: hypothetical protein H0T42_02555 [Deltaproteobacteria bacterium]|nr:hypothetical protein [Deltaproteobacteria bacterium]
MEHYRVTIKYSEPTYAQTRGLDVLSYVGVFNVMAADPEDAILRATDLFHEAQRSSGVSWSREISAASCELRKVDQPTQ